MTCQILCCTWISTGCCHLCRCILSLIKSDLKHTVCIIIVKQLVRFILCRVDHINFTVFYCINSKPVSVIFNRHYNIVSLIDISGKFTCNSWFCFGRKICFFLICKARYKTAYSSPVNITIIIKTTVFAQVIAERTRIEWTFADRSRMHSKYSHWCNCTADLSHCIPAWAKWLASPAWIPLSPVFITASSKYIYWSTKYQNDRNQTWNDPVYFSGHIYQLLSFNKIVTII